MADGYQARMAGLTSLAVLLAAVGVRLGYRLYAGLKATAAPEFTVEAGHGLFREVPKRIASDLVAFIGDLGS